MRSLIILLSFLLVCEGNIDSRCLQPVNGPVCRALVKRWSYDPTTNKCKTFMYGGCGGTENNFLSEEECIKTCVRRAGVAQSIRDPLWSHNRGFEVPSLSSLRGR
ncbi:hypothetical protein RB195_011192 [Necator americanus]|uniref:BPTI/Kunitz inhibitor domain-containing protein n=1 Tax=Necator americanus TaxID=51031 RepID=A0ABR1D2B6_NECAM